MNALKIKFVIALSTLSNRLRRSSLCSAVLLAATMSLPVAAFAQTFIYQDYFNRTGRIQPGDFTQVLKASTPSNTTNDQWWKTPWSSSSNSFHIQTSGTLSTYSATDQNFSRAAFLDFTPQEGFIYTLSVQMSVQNKTANTSGGFLAMGFSNNTSQIDTYDTAKEAWDAGNSTSYAGGEYTNPMTTAIGGWKLSQSNIASTFKNEGYSDATVGATALNDFNSFSVVLNTQGENWTIEWFQNDVSIRSATYDENPTISNISLSVQGVAGGEYKNLSLSVIPEPSMYALLVGSLGLFICLLRRR
jgi:hypothetical protein